MAGRDWASGWVGSEVTVKHQDTLVAIRSSSTAAIQASRGRLLGPEFDSHQAERLFVPDASEELF